MTIEELYNWTRKNSVEEYEIIYIEMMAIGNIPAKLI